MYQLLAPCPDTLALAGPASRVPRGVSRAAALALGATLVVTGCGKTTLGGPDDNGAFVAKYGGPPIDDPPRVDSGAPAVAGDSGPPKK